jgi:uncharacterized protein (TIGR03435 family)
MTRPLIFLVAAIAYAQSPAFEVASIKPSQVDSQKGMIVGSRGGPGTKDPGLFTCENCSLFDLVQRAYGIERYQLTALDWMRDARFIISAKIKPDATKEQFQQMLKQLLIERFNLKVHWDKKEMQMSELTVAKGGPKLKEHVDVKEAEADTKRDSGPMKLGADGYPVLTGGSTMAMMNGRARVMYFNETIEFFAKWLGAQMGRPVSDGTGLTGKYDIGLFWDGGSRRPSATGSTPLEGASDLDAGPDLPGALQSQLGLKLESKKGMIDVVVVDHAEKIPTEN